MRLAPERVVALKSVANGSIMGGMTDGYSALRPIRFVALSSVVLAMMSLGAAAPASDDAPLAATINAIGGTWQTDANAEIPLSALPGRVRVIAMFYSGCHMACPVTVEAMQWIEKTLSPAASGVTQFVLVTLDPGGDTVEELRGFRTEQRLSDHWTLLRGNRLTTRELADSLGISFHHDSVRLTHTAAIVVVGPDGQIHSRHTTLRPDLREVVKSVESLANTKPKAQRREAAISRKND